MRKNGHVKPVEINVPVWTVTEFRFCLSYLLILFDSLTFSRFPISSWRHHIIDLFETLAKHQKVVRLALC